MRLEYMRRIECAEGPASRVGIAPTIDKATSVISSEFGQYTEVGPSSSSIEAFLTRYGF